MCSRAGARFELLTGLNFGPTAVRPSSLRSGGACATSCRLLAGSKICRQQGRLCCRVYAQALEATPAGAWTGATQHLVQRPARDYSHAPLRLVHKLDLMLAETNMVHHPITACHIVTGVLAGSKSEQLGVQPGMYLDSVRFPVDPTDMWLEARTPKTYLQATVTFTADTQLALIKDLSTHFNKIDVDRGTKKWFRYPDDFVFCFKTTLSAGLKGDAEAGGQMEARARSGRMEPASVATFEQDTTNSHSKQPIPASAHDSLDHSHLPPKSLDGDIQLILDSGATFKAHALLLRQASPMLSQALDSAQLQQPTATGAEPLSSPLLLPTITAPQAQALLHALYCGDPDEQLAWVGQQPLSSLQDLATAAHALACNELLQLADTALAARASTTPSTRPPTGLASILLTPENAPVLLCWANSLGMKSFAGQAERAVELYLPHMTARGLAEVYADLHPAVVGRFLAQLQHQAQSNMVHAQALLQGGDLQGGKFMVSRALKAIEKMPR